MSLPRRKPLRRSGKGLQPSAPKPRPKRRPVPKRGRVDQAEYADLRRTVFDRAGGRCERCGTDLVKLGAFEAHHRKLRSQGGRDEVENLACLCPGCHHDQVHAHPAYARAEGWIVRQGSTPGQVAVVLWDGRTVRLDPDGGYDVVWNADGSAA